MKSKVYLSLGAFAAVAAMVALTGYGIAEETIDQPAVEQQDANQLDVNVEEESGQLQTETRQYGQRDTTVHREHDAQVHKNAFKASELIGMNVRGKTGDDDIGQIHDLMISKDGRVIYAAVSFGGFLGIGDKLFAVPLEAIEFVHTEDDSYARMDVTEQTLENKQGFNQDNWPQQASREFVGGLGTRQAERPETDSELPR
jgi:ribosomal 30S subunit maturation factor RimM